MLRKAKKYIQSVSGSEKRGRIDRNRSQISGRTLDASSVLIEKQILGDDIKWIDHNFYRFSIFLNYIFIFIFYFIF